VAGTEVLSVVVGTYNRREQLRKCVESVFRETTTPVRLFVTDAGSTDGTVEYLRQLGGHDRRVVPLLTGKKIGQARALNDVFRQVDSEFVCWLSDDNVVVNRGLDIAVDILHNAPRLGMVALKVKDMVGPWTGAPYIGGISPLGLLNVNQGMLRTKILRALGGFSEDYLDYGIDPDLTARVFFRGWDIAYTREVAIHHHREWLRAADSSEARQRLERQRRAVEIYRRKFARLGGGRTLKQWTLKKQLFQWARAVLARLCGDPSQKRIFGQPFRDWHNVFNARYISIWDILRYWNKPFHLVQQAEKGTRTDRRMAG
jgi:GT2 family glycosyltransferase